MHLLVVVFIRDLFYCVYFFPSSLNAWKEMFLLLVVRPCTLPFFGSARVHAPFAPFRPFTLVPPFASSPAEALHLHVEGLMPLAIATEVTWSNTACGGVSKREWTFTFFAM